MRPIFRDSTLGQCLRFLTRNRIASYPEHLSDFALPAEYSRAQTTSSEPKPQSISDSSKTTLEGHSKQSKDDLKSTQQQNEGNSSSVEPRRAEDGTILVTWYSDDDPDNPQNWGMTKKLWNSLLLLMYTFSVYIGSSQYIASENGIVEIFGVGEVAASLGLSLYVLAYGIGPMLFSPLSEIPAVGRNPPYVLTYIIFVILCVPTSLLDHFGGLLVLRFLLGFFGSPCLATAGASYGDFFAPSKMGYVIAFWGGGATLGPVSTQAPDWLLRKPSTDRKIRLWVP